MNLHWLIEIRQTYIIFIVIIGCYNKRLIWNYTCDNYFQEKVKTLKHQMSII